MRTRILLAVGGLVIVAAVALAMHLSRQRIHVGSVAGDRVPLEKVEHAAWDTLLSKYVDDEGRVAYRRWKDTPADVQALDQYLGQLGNVDLNANASKEERIAFWINAYNALTIKGILLKYPVASIKDIVSHLPGAYNVWRDLLLRVDGKEYSLEAIEHQILRPMGEPRIHFALVCASKGCPPLRSRAYSGKDLNDQLNDNAQRFFSRPGNFSADAGERVVHVSELLEWFGADFAETRADRLRVIRPYFPATETLTWLNDPSAGLIADLPYDWSLNEQPVSRP